MSIGNVQRHQAVAQRENDKSNLFSTQIFYLVFFCIVYVNMNNAHLFIVGFFLKVILVLHNTDFFQNKKNRILHWFNCLFVFIQYFYFILCMNIKCLFVFVSFIDIFGYFFTVCGMPKWVDVLAMMTIRVFASSSFFFFSSLDWKI